jgi:hypothetical protein
LFIAAGPSIMPVREMGAHIADTTATLLWRMGVVVPQEFSGRVLWQALQPHEGASHEGMRELPPVEKESRSIRARALVEQRLRALGYVD